MMHFDVGETTVRPIALLGILLGVTCGGRLTAEEPVAMRVESFVVAPAHLPPAVVVIRNLGTTPYEGTVRVKLPDGWRWVPEEQEVSLGPGETGRVVFMVKKGVIKAENSYPVEVTATGGGAAVTLHQDVACASAPYFKPTLDGAPDEWGDAIPVTFVTGGKKTTLSTYWNRRQFSVLVAVEEDELVPYGSGGGMGAIDAVQLAVSPQKTATGRSPEDEATRHEFLVVSAGEGGGKCFRLAQPGMKLAEAAGVRDLEPLELDKAVVAVGRKDGVTYYECGIPFRSLDGIRPSEGRELFLSVLVHDPDGTGVRDWGRAAGMWPSDRNPLAWSRWHAGQWGENPPFDNKAKWGLCSSKY